MSLCYDAEKWLMVTLASVAISLTSLTVGLVLIQYGHGQIPSIEDRQKANCESIQGTYIDGKCMVDKNSLAKDHIVTEDGKLIVADTIMKINTGNNTIIFCSIYNIDPDAYCTNHDISKITVNLVTRELDFNDDTIDLYKINRFDLGSGWVKIPSIESWKETMIEIVERDMGK